MIWVAKWWFDLETSRMQEHAACLSSVESEDLTSSRIWCWMSRHSLKKEGTVCSTRKAKILVMKLLARRVVTMRLANSFLFSMTFASTLAHLRSSWSNASRISLVVCWLPKTSASFRASELIFMPSSGCSKMKKVALVSASFFSCATCDCS